MTPKPYGRVIVQDPPGEDEQQTASGLVVAGRASELRKGIVVEAAEATIAHMGQTMPTLEPGDRVWYRGGHELRTVDEHGTQTLRVLDHADIWAYEEG